MRTEQERLDNLHRSLYTHNTICSSEGILHTFPTVLFSDYQVKGIGLVVCHDGEFSFSINNTLYTAHANDTLFIPEDSLFKVHQHTNKLKVTILIYQIDTIRELIGNMVLSIYPYPKLSIKPSYVWNTGDEKEVISYMSLIDNTQKIQEDTFNPQERRLLLLALTHRLCSIYSRKLTTSADLPSRKREIFIHLLEYVEKYYMHERSVEFYAEKLFLSPKYLSALSKSICGYTVQEIVFKAIIRKSILMLTNTQKTVQEISDMLNFPNASYFGTFFRKHTGMSPKQYRNKFLSNS